MDQATLARIFEPFFTTKERGRGTGLGLATVYGVVRQSDGHIHMESNPGAGTRFTICFPELQERSEAARDRKVSEQPPSRSGTILLVEDEEMVRRAAHAILTRRGYDVIQATGGEEALAIYGRHGASIDLVLTDVVMPGMTGGELASKLSRKDPDLRVVFMSGYPSDVKSVSLVPQEAFVAKPFTPATLVATVRAALDTQTSPRRRGNWRSQLPAD
jgi:CheY-like chemotaxis protein